MHPIDDHQRAGQIANQKLRDKYGKDDFEIGSAEHVYWLKCYDEALTPSRSRK